MGLRFGAARAISSVSTWGLKNIFRRPAANFPGKVALYVDPQLIANLKKRLNIGSIVVVGTNGKTTCTNLLADIVENSDKTAICNRTGANLDSGIATSLLQDKRADWGIFECDEMWLAKVLPQLQATYVLLLDLFRDQLDRYGDIGNIQESIVKALASSPSTILIYNADDPLCAAIADEAASLPQRKATPSIAFGVDESMNLAQESVPDVQVCHKCGAVMDYEFRQYDQLGKYSCPKCGFARPELDFAATRPKVGLTELSFEVLAKGAAHSHTFSAPFSGAYMVYNLTAVAAAAHAMKLSPEVVQRSINAYKPQNGRLQTYNLNGHHILLNLAKNPTGFNQNLNIICADKQKKIAAFFVNDMEGDGRDVSWLWDIGFEALAVDGNTVVYAGGMRANDLQVRMKYAGLQTKIVETAQDIFDDTLSLPGEYAGANMYLIANYTALPPVHEELDGMVSAGKASVAASAASASAGAASANTASVSDSAASENKTNAQAVADSNKANAGETQSSTLPEPLVIAHMYPDLLNLFGDEGNVKILQKRCEWRGLPVEVKKVCRGEKIDFSDVDLVFLGGSSDQEQRMAATELAPMKEDLQKFAAEGGPILGICAGFQLLGRTWQLGEELIEGAGVIPMTSVETEAEEEKRLVSDIALKTSLSDLPVIGYENHAARTRLEGAVPFGSVCSSVGTGNSDAPAAPRVDGALLNNVIGTYLHGPLLSKNPDIADWLLDKAFDRWAKRTGNERPKLERLSDKEERAAHSFMKKRLGL